ncbi:unnamed protein product [Enterobius vermicularis]|uniref:BRCT domain-containing protein n=1 Tax=Enterobius vermicularis TaxID=51028 RepID=A0A158QB55_ENTVE|nr:unnamed protein product [Enterobius vermicularis]
MSTSLEQPRESNGADEKQEELSEVGGQSADAIVSDGNLKESKKGLFGRSAEFLKSPEPNAMEVVEATERNGNVNEAVETSSPTNKSSGDSTEKEVDEKKLGSTLPADVVPESDDRGNGKESESEVPSKETVTVTVTVTEEVVEEVKADDVEMASDEKPTKEEEVAKEEEVEDREEAQGTETKCTTEEGHADGPPDTSIKGQAQEPGSETGTKRSRKSKQKTFKEEEPMNERRRSLRTPKPTPVSIPPKSATEKVTKKSAPKVEKAASETPVRGGGRKREEKAAETTPVKKSGSKPSSAKKSRSSESEKKPKAEQNSDANDPFNISNIDNHPVILSNIQIHAAQFGSLKFTKTSPGTSQYALDQDFGNFRSRYEKTEQTAGERRSNLTNMTPQSTPRKSLSELSTSTSQRQESARKVKRGASAKSVKESAREENEPMDTSEPTTPKSAKRSRGAAKTPSTGKKSETSRKRTSSMNATPISAKQQKVEPEIPHLTPEEQFVVDHRENEHMPYKLGARVYALWNREYYSAVITSDFDAAGRYGVTFVQDKLIRKLVVTGIIPLQALVGGIKVYASDPEIPEKDSRLEEVEIISSPSEKDHQKWAEGIFRVKICESGKTFDIAWDKLCFSAEEAKTLQTAKFNSVTDVIADNIDSKEGRRTRASRHSFAPEAAPSPSVSRPTPKRRANHADKPSEAPTTVEIGMTEKQVKQTKAAGDIFANISFVVTSAMRRMKEEEQGGFSKREIRQMIEGCGGNVVEDFTKIPAGSKMFLIADTHYRTHKYLSALARSVPCVSHRWIRECVEKGELLDYKPYMLQAGVSLLTNKLTPWHQSNNTLLSGKRIYIYTRNVIPDASVPNFVQIWSPLVAEMGATVVSEIPKVSIYIFRSDGIDILLTDATCTEDVIQQARKCDALAIIEGSLPDPNAHERFRYDFVERPEGM